MTPAGETLAERLNRLTTKQDRSAGMIARLARRRCWWRNNDRVPRGHNGRSTPDKR